MRISAGRVHECGRGYHWNMRPSMLFTDLLLKQAAVRRRAREYILSIYLLAHTQGYMAFRSAAHRRGGLCGGQGHIACLRGGNKLYDKLARLLTARSRLDYQKACLKAIGLSSTS